MLTAAHAPTAVQASILGNETQGRYPLHGGNSRRSELALSLEWGSVPARPLRSTAGGRSTTPNAGRPRRWNAREYRRACFRWDTEQPPVVL